METLYLNFLKHTEMHQQNVRSLIYQVFVLFNSFCHFIDIVSLTLFCSLHCATTSNINPPINLFVINLFAEKTAKDLFDTWLVIPIIN